MKVTLVLLLLLAPVPALASCEGLLTVKSEELVFTYVEATSDDGEVWKSEYGRQVYRSLAHALEMARRTLELVKRQKPAGAVRVVLLAQGRPAPEDLGDRVAVSVARELATASTDSTCILWTIEIGRFRTKASAQALAEENGTSVSEAIDYESYAGTTVIYDTCGGRFLPGPFVVHLPGATGPWSTRRRLYFSREDAERAAKSWGPRARVVEQRVDGALLERVLEQPLGC